MGPLSKVLIDMETLEKPGAFKHWRFITLAVLIGLHLVIALPLAYNLNIWVDEASTLHTTQNGLLTAIQTALLDEKQAPLYFWLLSLWRNIDSAIFFARLFSVICSVFSIKFFYDLSYKLFSKSASVFVSAIFAVHPFLIWASLEIRVYALVILLAVLLLNLYYNGFIDHKGTKTSRISFAVVAAISLYINYYVGFLLVACFLALLVLKRWPEARTFFLLMLAVGVAFLPMIWSVVSQLGVNTRGFQAERSVSEGVRALWGHVLTFTLPTEVLPDDTTSAWSIVRLWIVRLGILAMIVVSIKNRGKWIDRDVRCSAVISFVICVLLALGYFALGKGYIEIRHASILFVPAFLLAALVVTKLLPKKLLAVFACIYLVFVGYGISELYPQQAKTGDWVRVADFIAENENEGQPIIVFEAYDALCLPYHYKGVNQILPNKDFFIWDFEDSPAGENAFKKQIAFVTSQIPSDAGQIWLATEDRCQRPRTMIACQPLEDFVNSNYVTVIDRDFYRERVRLLKKLPKN